MLNYNTVQQKSQYLFDKKLNLFTKGFQYIKKETVEKISGLKRNIAIYKQYDDLRKVQYFSKDYRQKFIDGEYEYHLKEKRGGKWTFILKNKNCN